MNKHRRVIQFILITFCFLFSPIPASLAWQYEVQGGAGYGKEIDKDYHNGGIFLNGKFFKIQLDQKLILTLDPTIAYWHADTTANKNLFLIAFSPCFRAYFVDPAKSRYRPFLTASFGPTLMSTRHFGENRLGSVWAFQTTLGAGIEMGKPQQHSYDISVLFIHYCNANLFPPNHGSDIPFVLVFGYQF